VVDQLVADLMATEKDDRPEHMKRVVARIGVAYDEIETTTLSEPTNDEAPPMLLFPAEPSEVTEASVGWDAEQVTDLVVGPHVVGVRGTGVGFFDQDLGVHVVDPRRGLRRVVRTRLDAPPRALELWDEGVMLLAADGAVLAFGWDGSRRTVREADPDVTCIGGFPDGRAIVGLRTGECLVEQPNGSWKGHRAGRSQVEVVAASKDGVAVSSPDGAMLVSAQSFDVPLMHLGKPVDSFAFSSDAYLLGLAREGGYVVKNVGTRAELSKGKLPPGTRAVAFHENDLCAYLVDAGRLLRFRLGS
jgi:hypothetical protein